MVVIDGEMKSLTSEFIEQVTLVLMLMFMVKCEKVGSENLASESIELVLSNVLMLMFMGKSEKLVSEKLTSEFIEQVTVMLMLTFTVKVRVMKCHESQGFICGKNVAKI